MALESSDYLLNRGQQGNAGTQEEQLQQLNDLNANLMAELTTFLVNSKKAVADAEEVANGHYAWQVKSAKETNDKLKRQKEAADAAELAIDEKYAKKRQKIKEKLNSSNEKEQKAAQKDAEKLAEKEEKAKVKAIKSAYSRDWIEKNRGKIQQTATKLKSDDASTFASGLHDMSVGFASILKDKNANFNDKLANSLNAMTEAVRSLDDDILKKTEELVKKQGTIDTQLQGLSEDRTKNGSYYSKILSDINKNIAVSPFVKQEDVLNKVSTMIDQGVTYNVEQRAFLSTISGKIATTFDQNNGTLKDIIRIQQKDSTAARLGMESNMTAFLNSMYDTSEFMHDAASQVRNSILEATKLMDERSSVDFDAQLQKWTGSMYSVGVSRDAVDNIANAVGKIAAGQIEGITGGGTGNLALMAANQAGLSISDMLKDGLDASDTNKLMKAMTEYMKKLYNDSKDSRVVQQQIAKVYGLSASDLKAAMNLSNNDITAITGTNFDYNSNLAQLNNMVNTLYKRTSLGSMASNLLANAKFGITSSMAQNPILYTTMFAADVLDSLGGGNLPTVTALGTGVDLETNIADLMKFGALGGAVFGSIGDIIAGIGEGSAGGLSGSGMLKAFGVGSNNSVQRGSTPNRITSGASISESGSYNTVGNQSSDDIYNSTLAGANDQKKSAMAEAEESGDQDIKLSDVNYSIIAIHDLLDDVINGVSRLHVVQDVNPAWQTDNYTGAGL